MKMRMTWNEDVEEEEGGRRGWGNGAQAGSNEFKKFSAKLWKSDLPKKVHETFGYPYDAMVYDRVNYA